MALAGLTLLSLSGCQAAMNTMLPQTNPMNTLTAAANQGIQSPKWFKLERIQTQTPIEPRMDEVGRHRDPEITGCFGTAYPQTTDFCLHDAGSPAQLKQTTPVLLIHGANTTATRAWADPDGDGVKTGLMQHLKAQGFRVFAITFANKHGDNMIWSQHIHAAIQRIRQITGQLQVDALGHSKGGFALRMYVSNIGKPAFAHDVRKAIFVGTPHRGIDFTFRHSAVHWALVQNDDNPVRYAPMAWSKTLWQASWKNTQDWSFSGKYFPGQAQMLARWDHTYPLPVNEPDWYTTYHGGKGFVSESPGIEKMMAYGGNLVAKVQKSPVDPTVQVAVLAGNSPTVPGILNELTGPSDGVVFVKSAATTADLIANGAPLLASQTMPLHHLGLVSDPTAMAWITAQLKK